MKETVELRIKWPEIVRTAAYISPLVSLVLALITPRPVTLPLIMGLLSIGCSMILISPSGVCTVKTTCRIMLVQSALCLLFPVLILFLSTVIVEVYLNLVAVTPMLLILVLYLSGLIRDSEFLTESLIGWEYMLGISKTFYTVLYMAIVCFFFIFSMIGGLAGRILQILTTVCMGFLGILLHCRMLTKHSVLTGKFENGIMKVAGPSTLLKPNPGGRISLNYRIVYNRMFEYINDKQPFLSDSYTLDDLARSLYTNKSYLSKMVNACTGMNFSQYMNNFRVQYAMELFKKDTRLRVSELAMMSGFKSGVTFNLAFKLFLNQNPSEWCNAYKNSLTDDKAK